MSYDLSVAMQTKSGKYVNIATPERDSPTYNLSVMFRACTGWDFEQGKYYNAESVAPLIFHGIQELVTHESEYKQYDASNGWGTTEVALADLLSLYKCISDTSEEYEIPFNELYVRW